MSEPSTARAQIGVTGLAVMGRNLARNLARHGHTVAVHNRTEARTAELLEEFGGEGDSAAASSWSRPEHPPTPSSTNSRPLWRAVTSSSTAATPTSPTPGAADANSA